MGKAKRGGVFGMIRGSVGPATYSIGKDGAGKKQQIIREKPIEVANPRTRLQAIQRMKMVPIQFAMGMLSDIVDHSFKGVQEGWPSKRHFMSLAMKELDVPFITKGSLSRAIGGYQIAAGSLADLRLNNAVVRNEATTLYDSIVPFTPNIILNSGAALTDMPKTWAGYSAKLLELNPWLQDGDEIAVVWFEVANNGSTKNVVMKKCRCLIDTNFTTDTPAEYISDNLDFNVLYAFDQYNENPPYNKDLFLEDAISIATGAEGAATFCYLMGVVPAGASANGTFLTKPFDELDSPGSSQPGVPQTAALAINRSLAAISVVVSRRVGDSWDYTVSDICLSTGYLATVNTQALMEQAIASYMSDSVVDTSSSEYYLQLTQQQYENYDSVSFEATGSVTIEGTATAVKATLNGRIDPINGKVILFVDADGYVTMEGIDTSNALAYRGFRWKNASTDAYLNPANYVKAEDITNATNVEFATEVF